MIRLTKALLVKEITENISLPQKGSYILVLKIDEEKIFKPGRLSSAKFLPGIYLYVGRAKSNLPARLRRHFKRKKKRFWHIDYLLNDNKVKIKEALVFPGEFEECQLAQRIQKALKHSIFPLKKFGSSDCNCISHLIYLAQTKVSLTSVLFRKIKNNFASS